MIKYNPQTGEIVQSIKIRGKVKYELGPNEEHLVIMEGNANPAEYYVENGKIVERPELPELTAPSKVGRGQQGKIQDLPEDAEVSGLSGKQVGQAFEFQENMPGTWRVKVRKWPYKEKVLVIEVEDDLEQKLETLKGQGNPAVNELIDLIKDRI